MMFSNFSYAYLPSVYLPCWDVCQGLCPPFSIGLCVFLLLNFKCSLYILDNPPLLDMWFANMFSHSVAYLLIPFTVQKFLILMKSNVSIFLSLILYLVNCLKPHCKTHGNQNFLSCSRNFIFLHFTYKSVIQFELIFVKSVKVCV